MRYVNKNILIRNFRNNRTVQIENFKRSVLVNFISMIFYDNRNMQFFRNVILQLRFQIIRKTPV